VLFYQQIYGYLFKNKYKQLVLIRIFADLREKNSILFFFRLNFFLSLNVLGRKLFKKQDTDMNKLLTSIVFCAVISTPLLPLAASAESLAEREANQERRIYDGITDQRELNRLEYMNLERRQESIENQLQRNRIDGNGLNDNEQERINERLNNLSESIYRYKHNKY
jgi:hypothetical protein